MYADARHSGTPVATRHRPTTARCMLALGTLVVATLHAGNTQATPPVEFAPTDTLRGFTFADAMPWSPRGNLLALERLGGSDLHVYDAARPADPPRLIARGHGREQWSPDGAWIARLSRFPVALRNSDSIAVVAANGEVRQAVYAGPRVWPILWAADGQLYAWPWAGGAFRTLQTPLEPSEGNFASWPTLVLGPIEEGVLSLLRFVPDGCPRTEPLEMLDSTFGAGHKMLLDAVPEHGRFLVKGRPRAQGPLAARVIDVHGRAITPSATAQQTHGWHSLTHDGTAVLGAVVTTDDTEAANILGAHLFVEDAERSWRLSISGSGHAMNPWMSRDGLYLAYEDPLHGAVVVGRIVMGSE